MKKTINTLLILILICVLSSCFTSKNTVEDAKKDMGIIELDADSNVPDVNLESEGNEIGFGSGTKDDMDIEEKKEPKIQINNLTKEQFIELDDLSEENVLDLEVEITGKTLSTTVDKIIVTFKNDVSNYPVDKYTLKQFSSGDTTFLYRAFSRYETLDEGKNVYLFEAYSGEKVSKLELIINVEEESEEEDFNEVTEEVYEEMSFSELPTKESFGTPINLGNGKISYSDLNGLEVRKEVVSDLSCETLTSYLATKLDSWFFWNTCRPIDDDEGISFYVVRLDGDNYVYEKHYYLSYDGIYGVQELETGTGVTSKNIGDKNSELKDKNDEFTIVEVSDELFEEMLK